LNNNFRWANTKDKRTKIRMDLSTFCQKKKKKKKNPKTKKLFTFQLKSNSKQQPQ